MKAKVKPKKDLKLDLDELAKALDLLPPRPVPLDEQDAAQDEVMYRLRDELKTSVAELKAIQAGAAPKKWPPLGYAEFWALIAIYLLDGNCTSIAVADKVKELACQRVQYFQVTEAMLRLSRQGLIESSGKMPEQESDCEIAPFALTPEGLSILAMNREDSRRIAQVLAGLPE